MKPCSTIELGRPLAPIFYRFPTRPLPLDRPKFGMVVFDTPKNRAYRDAIAEYAALQHPRDEPFEGDLRVYLTFYFQTNVHGDIDNLIKSILDGVQERRVQEKRKWRTIPGVVMKNDKQVKALSCAIIIDKNELERTDMIVDRYNPEDMENARALIQSDSDNGDGGSVRLLAGDVHGMDF